ncbi:MAG TPA: hypothetical protein VNZ03_14850 [Terriglobales bacterium]|jgi:hypothetical protein|nr:hypothetical protein [Terriglobales bacterium]
MATDLIDQEAGIGFTLTRLAGPDRTALYQVTTASGHVTLTKGQLDELVHALRYYKIIQT